jgi:hypothetical protein
VKTLPAKRRFLSHTDCRGAFSPVSVWPGASTAGVLYEKMLEKSCPPGVTCESEIVYPGDPGFSFAAYDFTSYSGVAWTGSSLTIYSDTPAVRAQIELCKQLFNIRVPMFGRWGCQNRPVLAFEWCTNRFPTVFRPLVAGHCS